MDIGKKYMLKSITSSICEAGEEDEDEVQR